MADMFDYLQWRGDILFSQIPLNPVDALIFSTLSYVQLDGIVPEVIEKRITLEEAVKVFLKKPEPETKVRVRQDIKLLQAVAQVQRFRNIQLCFYRSILVAEEETQFAALTYLLEDGTAVLVFRGTDRTLVGWKEDFNMSFYESVPAQREALRYVEEFAKASNQPLYITGHSKGGNLAVYAAAKSGERIQKRILAVYNQDGPGFTEHMLGNPGYQAIVPKIHTYIPQSSVVGMLLEHEESYTVIKSSQIGVMQHNPYSWEILGTDFIHIEEVSEESRRLDKALKSWLSGMSLEERSDLTDTIYELFTSVGVSQTIDLVQPKNVRSYVKALANDEKKRQLIAGKMVTLLRAMKDAQHDKE